MKRDSPDQKNPIIDKTPDEAQKIFNELDMKHKVFEHKFFDNNKEGIKILFSNAATSLLKENNKNRGGNKTQANKTQDINNKRYDSTLLYATLVCQLILKHDSQNTTTNITNIIISRYKAACEDTTANEALLSGILKSQKLDQAPNRESWINILALGKDIITSTINTLSVLSNENPTLTNMCVRYWDAGSYGFKCSEL